ncbi:puromycin resistance protein pur8 [Nannizzia gypsea CBS 118893]|uniref:Puromycin resistance protein pur8 n=1 Tax=Arthroderma gypseum (strain ATCC MYA-4604 / CBS 118893) TaxID=535722 RepID=E4V458_ARTGP|nr:puromycin resistance protein pur8 [Nannizzia gypsea CBS 118893]EFR04782.1 puromycin resistance protein pur8 [Nannizzia gypsea CBS 118893]
MATSDKDRTLDEPALAPIELFPISTGQIPSVESETAKECHSSEDSREVKAPDLSNDRRPGALETPSEDGGMPVLESPRISKAKGATVIITLAGISFLNTMGSGILIAALPRIAKDVGLSESLILWPAAVYALAAGCLLLIFGAVADVIGAKLMWVVGSYLFVIFSLAIGFSQTSIQIILFRTFQGAAISMCLPTAVSLITNTFPKGPWRNVAFAMNGMGQPLGYAAGLVLGGIFTDTIGWRWAYYMMAIINFCLSTASIWSLPSVHKYSDKLWYRRLAEDIDWLGAMIMSVALGLLMYVLAMATSSYKRVGNAQNIALLVVSTLLLATFPFWMSFQVKRARPALIPNKLWKNSAFTSICASVFFCWASLNGIEYFTTLYFQKVEGITALQSSIRFLAHIIMGACVNVATAYLISRVKVQTLGVVSALISMIAPILMATIKIGENYWFSPFWALFLSPVNPDVLFTVSNLIISDAFPPDIQSLAGGVFNEVAQFGNSVGLAVTASIAASITDHKAIQDHKEGLMLGYRGAFWTIFSSCALVVIITFFGLRKGGTVGKKEE